MSDEETFFIRISGVQHQQRVTIPKTVVEKLKSNFGDYVQVTVSKL